MSSTTSSPTTSPDQPVELAPGFDPDEIGVGVVAAALPHLAAWGLEHPSLDEVLQEFGVSRDRAAEAKAAILELLPTVLPSREERLLALTHEVIRFLRDHPGTMEVSPRRRYYSHSCRRFVVELRGRYDELELGEFANAVNVPERKLAGWLRRAQRR